MMTAQEFPLSKGLIYLNHAAVSPWPKRTGEAIASFAEENVMEGAAHYPRWMLVEKKLREQLAQLLNANSTREIALVKNTSEAISFVASGLSWQKGDNIVGTHDEFPSNRIPWEALRDQGVSYRQPNIDVPHPEEAILSAIDDRTRLVAISSVQYASGLRLDLEKIGMALKARGILFLVDAIQSLGVHPIDVQKIHADFVMADGHKWLLAPEGLGVFYISERVLEDVKPSQFGWHMVENVGDYDDRAWIAAQSARKFECGSPNMLGIRGLSASLSLLLETGIENIESRVLEKTATLIRLIQSEPRLQLLSDHAPAQRSGITLFRHKEVSNTRLWSHLKSRNIVCALRGGGIRFSPHFYTPDEDLASAIRIAAEAV